MERSKANSKVIPYHKKKSASSSYDENYFENGMAMGVSLYENYRWLPELTIRMAYFMIKNLGIEDDHKVLDFGCAKGYLVKAFRLLDINACGCDISEYAIKVVESEVKEFCMLSTSEYKIPFSEHIHFDWIIAKDVLEHMDKESLIKFLKESYRRCNKMMIVVPLGDGNKFIVPEYDKDSTHILAKNEEWWNTIFEKHGWKTLKFQYSMTALKENWAQRYPKGNGIFTLEKNKTSTN